VIWFGRLLVRLKPDTTYKKDEVSGLERT
jgi:hypothetical protein